MDIIHIKDLEIYAYHGVNEDEKKNGQPFFISADLVLKAAPLNDGIGETVNYADVCKELAREFTQSKYNLIETCAARLADYILSAYDKVQKVTVSIKKPYAPIEEKVDYVAAETTHERRAAYISLGSNLGDKEKNLLEAIKAMNKTIGIKVQKISSFYVTKPVGFLNQDDFLNAAALIETTLSPHELLAALNRIEADLGRVRTIKNGPRTIDLDILLIDGVVCDFDDLTVPHPRMHERKFALEPLNEIAPLAVHPILNKPVFALLKEL